MPLGLPGKGLEADEVSLEQRLSLTLWAWSVLLIRATTRCNDLAEVFSRHANKRVFRSNVSARFSFTEMIDVDLQIEGWQ